MVGPLQVLPESRVWNTENAVWLLFKTATVKWPGVEGSAATRVLLIPGAVDVTGTRCRLQVSPPVPDVWNTVQGAAPPTKNAQAGALVETNVVATCPNAAARSLLPDPSNWLTPSVPPARWGCVQFTPSCDAATKASLKVVWGGVFGSTQLCREHSGESPLSE